MSVCQEIDEFTKAIGATAPTAGDAQFFMWKQILKRPNYFRFLKNLMIVKISRLEKPFWGVGKPYIDLFNEHCNDYYLVLLAGDGSGWVFRKAQVNSMVENGTWKEAKDNNYKMNTPLPDSYHFHSANDFLNRHC